MHLFTPPNKLKPVSDHVTAPVSPAPKLPRPDRNQTLQSTGHNTLHKNAQHKKTIYSTTKKDELQPYDRLDMLKLEALRERRLV